LSLIFQIQLFKIEQEMGGGARRQMESFNQNRNVRNGSNSEVPSQDRATAKADLLAPAELGDICRDPSRLILLSSLVAERRAALSSK
jgi:hypothetical protein